MFPKAVCPMNFVLEAAFQAAFMEEQLQIRVAPSEDVYDSPPDFDVSLHDGDFDAMLLRFQHAFVEDFHFGISDSAFLQHFRANAQNLEFLVKRIWFDSKRIMSSSPSKRMHAFSTRPRGVRRLRSARFHRQLAATSSLQSGVAPAHRTTLG